MLEKIGLPSKPSLRGNNWVVDASHCQSCSSHFTFINRKHHCRRCGGIFCNSCTQQRMFLRGQGESPVRICDACKSLEEAARFERYGHKTRPARGTSKLTSKKEDDILNQVLGNYDKSASSSNITEEVEGGDITRNLSLDSSSNTFTEVVSATPEELREQATQEKKKYKTLKAEGKPKEALRAFKRGKELERQAGAVELSLRKNRKKASSLSNNLDESSHSIADVKAKSNISVQKSKAKDDIFAELKELGWSDMDVEKKPTNLSLEGELSSLLKEVAPKPDKENKAISSDKSQVIAIKKRALELKRSGNLIEAKEELKRAKILERKIEEEELLGEGDESDDELSALIRNMDEDEHDDLSAINKSDLNFSFDNFVGIPDDLAMDGNFEVTDEDMDDPDIVSALETLGWTEEHHEHVKPANTESLRTQIQSLKREALSQKRAGNSAEAMSLLKKAKLLEAELESSENGPGLMVSDSGISRKGPNTHTVEESFLNVDNASYGGTKFTPKSKLTIQRELLALKKKALSLRREGKLGESEEELKKAKILEEQLESMNKAPAIAETSNVNKHAFNDLNATLVEDDENDEEVTDQDLHDPSYLSLLKNLGWDEEENAKKSSIIADSVSNVKIETSRKSKSEIQKELLALKRKALMLRRQGEGDEADEVLKMTKLLETQLQEYEEPVQIEVSAVIDKESESRTENSARQEKFEHEKVIQESAKPLIQEPSTSSSLQQEIMAHKRKALFLKREGKLAEAKEELRQAKLLEKENSESSTKPVDSSSSDIPSVVEKKEASPSSVSKPVSSRDKFKLQQQSLGHKRQALKLRREGKTAEADAEFELAKALELQLQELDSQDSSKNDEQRDAVMIDDFLDPQLLSALQSVGLGDVQAQTHAIKKPEPVKSDIDNGETERAELVERIKTEKVKAVSLKRSGKQGEALDALRRAKLYEKKLQSLTPV